MKSSEQIARSFYEQLGARDKRLVLDWRARGANWADAVVNSGVLTDRARIHPDQAARDRANEEFERNLLAHEVRTMPTDAAKRRRETAEHEAAHTIVAKALDVEVFATAIHADGGGSCLRASGTPTEKAIIATAGWMWIGRFRTQEFLSGPTGCDGDLRAAVAAVGLGWPLDEARRRCHEILKENSALVLATADRLDRDGYLL
ncbi:MAG: hypothetical protein ACRDRO_11675 [Pseudonocardiaceae bacterium]